MRAPRPASRRDHSPRLIQPGSDKRLPRTRTCARASVNRTPVERCGRSLLRCRRPRGRRCRRRRCPCIHGTQFYRRERLRTGTAAGSSGDSSSSTLDENFGSADEENPPIALPTFAKRFPIETAFPTSPGTGLETGPLVLTMEGNPMRTPPGASESWAAAARQRRLCGGGPSGGEAFGIGPEPPVRGSSLLSSSDGSSGGGPPLLSSEDEAGGNGGGLSQPTSILTAASVTKRSMPQPGQRDLATGAGWIGFGAIRRPRNHGTVPNVERKAAADHFETK
jgi:hypothetical protein